MRSLSVHPVLLVLFSSGIAAAQASAPSAPAFVPFDMQGHYRLVLSTGELSAEPMDGGPSAPLDCGDFIVNSFVNLDAGSGYIDGLTTMVPVEYVDWGVVTTESTSDIVTEFRIGYGTFDADTSVGGDGASVSLSFYRGYQGPTVVGDTVRVDEIARFELTGLPAKTSSTGGPQGFFVTVDLRGGFEFELPEGPFGFSSRYPTAATSGFTSTGLVQSLAGDPLGDPDSPDQNGQVARLDLFAPDAATGVCIDSRPVNYDAGTGLPVGSHYLLVRKVNAEAAAPAAAAVRNDSGGQNPLALFPAGRPVLGDDMTFVAAAADSSDLGVFLAGFAAPAELPTPAGVLLVDIVDPGGELLSTVGLTGPHPFAGGFVAVTTALPPNVELCGRDLFVQAARYGGGLQLTNAVDLRFGVY